MKKLYYIVSLHQTTTTLPQVCMRTLLYYIVSLHQTTTWYVLNSFHSGCIISFLYIKPQLCEYTPYQRLVVLYRFSTSNHNKKLHRYSLYKLYYIVSLHQTTTERHDNTLVDRCIISFLYIKPQPWLPSSSPNSVVLYRFSTSNHNSSSLMDSMSPVVLYRFSTSNHNVIRPKLIPFGVVLYRFSTSNHNQLEGIEFLAQLYYIVSLHQTTTITFIFMCGHCCIISFLYIKPQLCPPCS